MRRRRGTRFAAAGLFVCAQTICAGLAGVPPRWRLLGSGTAAAQGRASNVTEEEQVFQAAEAAFKSNQDEEALKLYEKVTAMNPGRADAWLKRGVILYKRRQDDEAVTVLTKAREAVPDDLDVRGQLGLSLYRLGRLDEAVALLESVVAKRPDSYQLELQLGQHYVKMADGKRAVAAFERYFESRPESAASLDVQVRALSGTAYLLDHRYPEAERDLLAVLRVHPSDGHGAAGLVDLPARVSLGAVYTARGDWSRAVVVYEHLLDEAERQPAIRLNLGTAYLQLHRTAEAEKSALAYTAARPGDARGFVLLGDARAQVKAWPGAREAYQAARKLASTSGVEAGLVDEKIGGVALAERNWEAAATAYEAAAKARPEASEPLVGLVQASLGEEGAARAGHRPRLLTTAKLLAAMASDSEAQLAAAQAYEAAGDFESAAPLYARAYDKAPQNHVARVGMRRSLTRQAGAALDHNDLALAEQRMRAARDVDPTSVQTNRDLGLVLLLAGKSAEAEQVLLEARKRVDKDLVVNRLLGRAAASSHRVDDAIRYYEAALPTAQRLRGPTQAELNAELGPLYLKQKKTDQAVALLETAVKEAGSSPVRDAAVRNLGLAYLQRGLDRLRDARQAEGALDDLGRAAATPKPAFSTREAGAVGCALALATLKVGRPQAALEAIGRAVREGACALKSPYDRGGMELFQSYAAYRETGNPVRLEAAARGFQRALPKASGALAELLKDLLRSAFEIEGYDLYGRGQVSKAATALRSANKVTARAERRELDHNLAVIDMEEGREAAAEKVFESLGGKPPEALANLGILRDRSGEAKKALDLYKRALEKGARSPRLKEWVDVKERLLATTGGSK